ncbi:Uncharacterised protein [Escherichia coli]|nr:Uncharacterised protein [Escherichia coli]
MIPLCWAARTTAIPSGCCEPFSTAAATRKRDASPPGLRLIIPVTVGEPSVSVPVLSTTSVSTFSRRSRASAFLINTPAWAPLPTPTIIDIGVASPSAQGQAIIRTDTAAIRPCAILGSGPQTDQITKATTAISITRGTNQPETLSAILWMGARERCASATI